ncbi:fungal-specific transcription factor domain-containing protein [Podospora australis]|uniref:Fungal-specific transcription factor domain-containing protein n=1 Tax=Podospora australis TaxID=1536484 RepID=A0AAN6X2G8_9PEZI|nr:fungal-specific transcription factor domain-containing protein [Podospora australis]
MSSSSGTPSDTIMVSDPNGDNGGEKDHHANGTPPGAGGNSSVPKPKRLACMICRKRKLKCDGLKPSCSTCSRLGHTCAYDEVRRKSGPKRGYVKALEERLKQVETMLKSQDIASTSPDGSKGMSIPVEGGANQQQATLNQRAAAAGNFNVGDSTIRIAGGRDWNFNAESPSGQIDDFNFNSNVTSMGMGGVDNNFTWEMIGLGLEEPLPPQETIDELHQIYFEKIHPSVPMIHKFRYLAAMNLAPAQRPPVCLRYAMWTLACSVTEKYQNLKDLFYQRARKYVEADYIKGYGEHIISVAHAQTHVLLSSYEFKWMYFPRAWMSTGSAVRLCQMIGLHRLDGSGLDVKQCLPPSRDWTEREERRRTFWMAFCQDRYASIGTGWPMTIDEKDILTNLPCSEEAFELSRPEQTPKLSDAMSPQGAGKLSPFGGIILLACLFGRNLVHLHRPDADDRDHDLNGEFWKRHRQMDNILLNTSLCLPSRLKLPNGLTNPNIVFMNMCIHTSTICLHQAAIFKADKNRLPSSVSSESKVRCITSANEIASIMRMISHLDLSAMNPFISFCLYVSARVFVQYLKSRPDDGQTADSLRFLLAAMNALKKRNPLTESFLVQLDVDLEALGVRIPKLKSAFPRSTDSPGPSASNLPTGLAALAHGEAAAAASGSRPNNFGYSQECIFMRAMGDDGNPANAPDITETNTGNANAAGFPEVETPSLANPGRAAAPYISTHGLVAQRYHEYGAPEMETVSNEMSGTSPGGGQSNRPTPNSSTASEPQQQQQQQQQSLASGGHLNSTGGNSFEASPVASHQGLGSMSGTARGEMGSGVNDYTFPDPSTFGLPSGVSSSLTPDQPYITDGPNASDYPIADGWDDISNQTGLTPGVESTLRSMISTMDIEMGWESTH